MTVQEPEWDEWDRQLLRALHTWEQSLCPGCGQPWDESLHRTDDETGKDRPNPYTAEYVLCDGCEAMETERALQAASDLKDARTGHRHWRAVRRETGGLTDG